MLSNRVCHILIIIAILFMIPITESIIGRIVITIVGILEAGSLCTAIDRKIYKPASKFYIFFGGFYICIAIINYLQFFNIII